MRTVNTRRNYDRCDDSTGGYNITKVLPLTPLTVYPTAGNIWLTDIIEGVSVHITTGSFMNFGDTSMFSKLSKHTW